MCGIAGILSLADRQPVDRVLLHQMNRVITHRGPDSDGYFVEPGWIGLAVRRLAVIDLVSGDQPVSNEEGTIWVTFNGEIYNFVELRRQLESRGHRFKTKSDTEVIVHSYEEHGDDFVSRLRGMFTIALWDSRRHRLLLARDRVGIKQLFYALNDGQLLWGSEIKCLLQHPKLERRLQPRALNQYLNYLYVPAPSTMFEGIHELEAGHMLVAEDGEIRTKKYWELDYAVDDGMSEKVAAEELLRLLDEVIRLHLVSDVPMGVFLSGGIDSGAIAALMARAADTPVTTFSIGYEDGGEQFDERPAARKLAATLGTEHHEFIVRPDLRDLLPKLVRAFDQPVADSSAVPNWYLSELTRQHVTVALSGLGGDELAAGYERYRGTLLADRARRLPRWLRSGVLQRLIQSIPDSGRGSPWVDRAKRFLGSLDMEFDERYLSLVTAFNPVLRSELLTEEVRRQVPLDEPRELFQRTISHKPITNPLNRMLFLDLKLYLPGDLLTLTDRMSMAHSLEVRVPFLDHRLLEFMATVPPALKLRGVERKYILKRALRDVLPRDVLQRRKMGFSVPLTVWFRRELRPLVEDVLGERRIKETGVFSLITVRRIVDDHFNRRANYDNQIWSMILFMLWHEEYLRQSSSESSSPHVGEAPTAAYPYEQA